MTIEKDRKGKCYIIDHVRGGYHECIWLTVEEMKELKERLDEVLIYGC